MGFIFYPPTIVGGTVLIIERIQSQNYVLGSAGWVIEADGDAEFNDVTVRGKIIGGNENGAHIEINGFDAPNGIALYTGHVDETSPGEIQPTSTATTAAVYMRSPEVSNGNEAQLYLEADTAGRTLAELSAHDTFFHRFDTTGTIKTDGEIERIDFTTGVDEIWHVVGAAGEPAFAGNWAVQGGVTVGFYKDASGRVQLRGRATEPVALSAIIFTLPVGYRPSQAMSWGVKVNNDAGSMGWISITTGGAVTVIGNAAFCRVQTVLDAISFPIW